MSPAEWFKIEYKGSLKILEKLKIALIERNNNSEVNPDYTEHLTWSINNFTVIETDNDYIESQWNHIYNYKLSYVDLLQEYLFAKVMHDCNMIQLFGIYPDYYKKQTDD